MPMTQDEILGKVQEILVEALGVDDDEVKPEATLMGDLGAESFAIKIPAGDLFPDNIQNNPEFVENGKLTPAGLTKLKESLPHVDLGDFESDPDLNKMQELFKVQTIVNYVASRANG